MTGQEYLKDIRTNLESGRYQHRMGENILRAFGYARRRATALDEINATLNQLGLVAEPPINSEMPLRVPRIRFSLKPQTDTTAPTAVDGPDILIPGSSSLQIAEDDETNLPEPAFRVSELTSANSVVHCLSSTASIEEAYTTMLLHNYSQLVVADQEKPRQTDIKGIVSYQSIAKALMSGKPSRVGDCMDHDVPFVQSDTDLDSLVSQLQGNDVALVIGRDKRLQGIVTAWDLAEEFAGLVNPFKRIGEIEERLRTLVEARLGRSQIAEFLGERRALGDEPTRETDGLTMGEVQRVLEFPAHWAALRLPFDRVVFTSALDEVRRYRNRLMHFGDPLDKAELTQLTNFCDTVREIRL